MYSPFNAPHSIPCAAHHTSYGTPCRIAYQCHRTEDTTDTFDEGGRGRFHMSSPRGGFNSSAVHEVRRGTCAACIRCHFAHALHLLFICKLAGQAWISGMHVTAVLSPALFPTDLSDLSEHCTAALYRSTVSRNCTVLQYCTTVLPHGTVPPQHCTHYTVPQHGMLLFLLGALCAQYASCAAVFLCTPCRNRNRQRPRLRATRRRGGNATRRPWSTRWTRHGSATRRPSSIRSQEETSYRLASMIVAFPEQAAEHQTYASGPRFYLVRPVESPALHPRSMTSQIFSHKPPFAKQNYTVA